ncbi:30 kDa salivary gland allergen Aed a 3-like [Anopheles maculipalpis]|uniref:30 kDa salivary gland allergen Aed a 3-like n=1 Tax=Anopheles maculipalpis TaxID=1496333 RepID=UPI0021597F62|nr:30 kDa salivary gland allergen Aed a 3-like [Anopheles maculipalpis]
MKSLLLLASVLCLALIVSARPSGETTDQESSTELSEGTSDDYSQEEDTSETDATAGTDESESEDGTGELESSSGEDHADDAEGAEEHEDGSEDTAGEEGDAGEEGEAGEAGEDGEAGEAGEAGEEGKAGEDGEAGDDGEAGEESGSEGGEESPINTYRQVHTLLENIMKVGTKDSYLKSYILARLQERLMNPTIDLVGTISKYSKIKECFSSLANDVSTLVKDSEKSYEECNKDKNNANCGTEGTRGLDDGLVERQRQLSDCIVEKRDSA